MTQSYKMNSNRWLFALWGDYTSSSHQKGLMSMGWLLKSWQLCIGIIPKHCQCLIQDASYSVSPLPDPRFDSRPVALHVKWSTNQPILLTHMVYPQKPLMYTQKNGSFGKQGHWFFRDVIHRTKSHSSFTLWFSTDVHMPKHAVCTTLPFMGLDNMGRPLHPMHINGYPSLGHFW